MGIQADGLGFRVDTHGSDKNELIGVSLMGVLKRLWAERMWVRRKCGLEEDAGLREPKTRNAMKNGLGWRS